MCFFNSHPSAAWTTGTLLQTEATLRSCLGSASLCPESVNIYHYLPNAGQVWGRCREAAIPAVWAGAGGPRGSAATVLGAAAVPSDPTQEAKPSLKRHETKAGRGSGGRGGARPETGKRETAVGADAGQTGPARPRALSRGGPRRKPLWENGPAAAASSPFSARLEGGSKF